MDPTHLFELVIGSVTRGDGDIGGYAYGADRKRALLHREGAK